jgi:uncharacterized lipoprotein YmbA
MKETHGAAFPDGGSLGDALVGIGPITVPEYYNRPQIVTTNNDDTIGFAEFDRWAEPLHMAMTRIIAQDFSLILPNIHTQIFPWNSALPVRYQVIIEVTQLNCRLNGEARLSAQWSILDAREKKMLLTKRSEYHKAVGNGTYAGLAQAISAICESLSRDIAHALIELGTQPPVGT